MSSDNSYNGPSSLLNNIEEAEESDVASSAISEEDNVTKESSEHSSTKSESYSYVTLFLTSPKAH
ncbi:hypothetical protein HanPSC8_Chr10g0448861 [Helianthus annuus]|nr:hypothetical protein HanPSC8_Chr10g0448861 [Helianthus annuus]